MLDGEVVGEGKSSVIEPVYDPGRHAEIEAIEAVDTELWPRAAEMTCYTTLEPCVMCAGTLLLHGVGRVVFGARDEPGGAGCVLEHLPPYYDEGGVYEWEGPLMPEACRPLCERAHQMFEELPVGHGRWRESEPEDPEQRVGRLREKLDEWLGDNPEGLSVRQAREATEALCGLLDAEEFDEILPYAVEIFRRGGYLKDYRALEDYARRANRAEIIEEVEETLRRELPDLWVRRALERGDVDLAAERWFEIEGHARARHVADELMEASGGGEIELIISCRMAKVTYLIGRSTRRHYRQACTVLRKLRDELRRAGGGEFWQHVLEDLQREYSNRPALLDELSRADFI